MPSLIERPELTPVAGSVTAAASSTTPLLEIRVLGSFEVRFAGSRIAVSGSKRDAMLAVLGLVRGRVMGVEEELIDALWEDAWSSGEAWREAKERARAARDEFESRAAEMQAELSEGGGYVHGARRHP